MEIYILKYKDSDDIIAITEDKSVMRLFVLQNDFSSEKGYVVYKENNTKIANTILLVYEKYYLIEYRDFIVRERDINHLEEIIQNEYSKLEYTVANLSHILDDYNLKPKHQLAIDKTLSILVKQAEKDIDKLIDVPSLIRDYMNCPMYHKLIEELESISKFKI